MLETSCSDVTDEDRSGVGRRLEARCDVRRVAERDRLGIGAAHEPHRRWPAVHTDSYGEPRDPPRRLDVARVPADDLEDAQGRARSALGIVLVRGGHAEVGADPVALVRLHDAAVLVDRTAHHRHALADEHLRLVGLEPLAERRRADDVGEEHGDGATLVLHPTRSRRGGRRGSRYRVRPARHRGRCERSRRVRASRPGAGWLARAGVARRWARVRGSRRGAAGRLGTSRARRHGGPSGRERPCGAREVARPEGGDGPAPGAHRRPPARVRPRASLRIETRVPRAACPRAGRSRPVRTARTPDRRVQAHATVRWRVRGSPRLRRTTPREARIGLRSGAARTRPRRDCQERRGGHSPAVPWRACCRRRGACRSFET